MPQLQLKLFSQLLPLPNICLERSPSPGMPSPNGPMSTLLPSSMSRAMRGARLIMNGRETVAIASAAFGAMVPAAAHAYSLDGLYAWIALFFGLPALLSLIAGFALSTYVKAIAAAVTAGVGGIVIWGYNIGFVRPGLFHILLVIGDALIALAAHALRRYWLSSRTRGGS